MDRFFDGKDEWVCKVIDHDKIVAFLSIEVHHEEDEEYIYLDDLSVTKSYRKAPIADIESRKTVTLEELMPGCGEQAEL